MTLIHKLNGTDAEKMDIIPSNEINGKSLRPVRNRRYTRRNLVGGQRPLKRLFTPEIKRYLKDWLVRRRENPYPNREEKKHLADETGLTYIQICNWFANWRRKLKNTDAHKSQQTWGHLIRTYNDRAQGNVEQFSISSDDSIWSESGQNTLDTENLDADTAFEDSLESIKEYQLENSENSTCPQYDHMMNSHKAEDLTKRKETVQNTASNIPSPLLLSKWLESAARFQPSETNYSCWVNDQRRKTEPKVQRVTWNKLSRHDQDEVEAAVALTALAHASST